MIKRDANLCGPVLKITGLPEDRSRIVFEFWLILSKIYVVVPL